MRPYLSHHAYERWCERAWPGSYRAVAQHILTPERVRWIALGACRIPMPDDGVVLVVRDGAIVTVETRWMHVAKRRARHGAKPVMDRKPNYTRRRRGAGCLDWEPRL